MWSPRCVFVVASISLSGVLGWNGEAVRCHFTKRIFYVASRNELYLLSRMEMTDGESRAAIDSFVDYFRVRLG